MINKSEAEIMQNWQGNISKPLVSICCTTYNHECYINEALDSFLMQETDFPFEIIVRDDASTDNTANVIREYEKKFPSIIKPIYELENRFQKGVKPLITTVSKANGQYIAICEGDDYWISTKKLYKQAILLNENPNINFCFHKAKILNLISKQTYENNTYIDYSGIVSANLIIATLDKLMVPTASIMIRATIIDVLNDYITKRPWLSVGDFYFRIFGVVDNGALYINETMSVYRYFTPNSWTISYINQQTKKITHAKSAIASFLELNEFFESKFEKEFFIITKSMILGILSDKEILLKYKTDFLSTIFNSIPYYRSINQKLIISYIIIKSYVKKIILSTLSLMGYKKTTRRRTII